MIVLSYFCRPAPPSLANHRRYADQHGYRHEWVDASSMPDSLQSRCLYKYQVLLHALRRAEPNELLLLLSEDAAIVDPVPLEGLMDGRDWLLVRTESELLPQVDVQIWRNTTAVRESILEIFRRCRLYEPIVPEAELLARLDTHPWGLRIAGAVPVMQAGYNVDPLWDRERTFAISIANAPAWPPNPQKLGPNPRYRDVLVDRLNWSKATGFPTFSFPEYATGETAEHSVYNPGQPIAIIMLYTPNIASFARIAEHNFYQYCHRHGYTLYVYRDIPADVGANTKGNWAKAFLLDSHIAQHEWVIWLDADVLIAGMDLKLESMLEDRDLLLAHDIANWRFNSGVMGFRRTARNEAILKDLITEIRSVDDKSGIYASGGDQHYTIMVLERHGLLNDDVVMEQVSVNTYWEYRRPDSFIVHYAGMWYSMRALVMAHDNALLSE
jgi:hypothetical protein